MIETEELKSHACQEAGRADKTSSLLHVIPLWKKGSRAKGLGVFLGKMPLCGNELSREDESSRFSDLCLRIE